MQLESPKGTDSFKLVVFDPLQKLDQKSVKDAFSTGPYQILFLAEKDTFLDELIHAQAVIITTPRVGQSQALISRVKNIVSQVAIILVADEAPTREVVTAVQSGVQQVLDAEDMNQIPDLLHQEIQHMRVKRVLNPIRPSEPLEPRDKTTGEIFFELGLVPDSEGQWSVSYASDELAELTGFRPNQLAALKREWESLIHPDDIQQMKRATRLALSDGQSHHRRYRFRIKDSDDYIWLEDRLTPIKDQMDRVIRMHGVAKELNTPDMTERDRLLRVKAGEAAEKLARFGVWMYDVEHDKFEISEEIYRIYGKSPMDPITDYRQLFAMTMEEDIAVINRKIRQAQEESRDISFEHRIELPDGEVKHLVSFVKFQRRKNGTVRYVIGSTQDISVQKNFEREVMVNRQKSHDMVETAPGVVYIIDYRSKKLIEGADRFARLYGYRKSEIAALDQGIYELVHPDDMPKMEEQEKRLESSDQGVIVPLEFRLLHKEGHYRWSAVYSKVFARDHDGKPIMGIGSVIDITERKESEIRFQTLANNAAAGIFITTDNKIVYANPAMADLTGFTQEELIGRSCADLSPSGEGANSLTCPNKVLLSGEKDQEQFEYALLRKNGDTLDVEMTASRIESLGKKSVLFIAVNITQKKRQFQHIEESEIKLRGIYHNAYNFIMLLDGNGSVVEVNERTREYLGEDVDKLIGNPISDSPIWKLDRSEKDHLTWELTGVLEGHFLRKELVLKGIDGDAVLDVTFSPIKDANDQIAYIILEGRNITHVKQVEQTYQEIFNHSIDLIYIQNEKGEFLDVNDAVVEKYGMERSEIVGRTPEIFAAPGMNDINAVREALSRAWEGEKVQFDWWSKKANGDVFPKEVLLHKGRYKGRDVIIASGRDISARKKVELEKSELIDQLTRQNRDLEQFSYIISHNLRGPVASILGLTEILDRNSCGQENAEIMDLICESTNNLDKIIKDLNKTISIRNRSRDMKEEIDVSEVVESVKTGLKKALDESGARIFLRKQGIDSIYSIKSYIQNILHNLVSNSIKYRHPLREPEIHITLSSSSKGVVISVKDNGLGIDVEKHQQRIFRLYERFNDELGVTGRGLGLYLVKSQVDALGGTINVVSRVGAGADFVIDLPY
ncbi:PAS domain S-box protein [bacterium SCSIO 12741]|nr:PAS domain S-box protein [bacterium SCSIO 12741]